MSLVSALNDLLFCERRCAMHRIEGVWVENPHTLEGTAAHGKAHQEEMRHELPGGGRLVRGMWLRNERLGLVGKADVVEFHPAPGTRWEPGNEEWRPENEPSGTALSSASYPAAHFSFLIPYPVEYKRGRWRRWDNDDVQLCAQALCLEEMLDVEVPRGAIFHIKSKRRREVILIRTCA